MTEQDNKLLAEWLGIPYERIYWGLHKDAPDYPDFSHRDAFWLILEKGPSCQRWVQFMYYIGSVRIWNEELQDYCAWCIPQDFISPRLAEELLRFVKEGKG